MQVVVAIGLAAQRPEIYDQSTRFDRNGKLATAARWSYTSTRRWKASGQASARSTTG
jgi:hypothetical protein